MSGLYTIDGIARELGVSKTTVSRAISGKGRISAETREKVLAFIDQHDFRPNAAAKSLAESRSRNLALVLPEDGAALDQRFFRECMEGVCQMAAHSDYDVLLTMSEDGAASRLERIIANRKVDGVIAARSEALSPLPALLRAQSVPFVLIGESSDPDVICVDNSNRRACRDLTALLLDRGLTRMALLGGDERFNVTLSRRSGFLDAFAEAGLEPDAEMLFLGIADSGGVERALVKSLRRDVECVVCMDDFLCSLTLSKLREMRLRVPQDVRVACFYDSVLMERMAPAVTAVRFNAVELGRMAFRELLALMDGRRAQSRVLTEYRLMLRESTD